MIQDIHPHMLDMTYREQELSGNDYVIVVNKNKILLRESADGGGADGTLPRAGDLASVLPSLRDSKNTVRLFSIDGNSVHLFTGETGGETKGETESGAEGSLPGFVFKDTFVLRAFQPGWLGFAAVTGFHLAGWYASNRFCGGCGARTGNKGDERALLCPACGSVVYPRISPAVIVGVVDGDRILMTRYANRPNNTALTALVAGFMEIGETLENTVAREVGEEVGVKVKNIRYYKSQPWAFSGSVLVGFYADLDGSPDITVDENELQEARWIAREDIPDNLNLTSLTATMVDAFKRNDFPA